MADHTVTLTDDQERALAADAASAQDPAVTVDTLLAIYVANALSQLVGNLILAEASQLKAAYLVADPATRATLLQEANVKGGVSSTTAQAQGDALPS